jgi:outer membrane lipoprotein-sorting protein
MIVKALLLALSMTVRAASTPLARDVLRQSLVAPEEAYSAELTVTRHAAKGPVSKSVRLGFSPPSSYRREIRAADGTLERLIVSDGKIERSYDPSRKIVREGEVADPLYKRLGPDEELERLEENYETSLAFGPDVAGRPTWLLELRPRAEGRARRRLWVDRKNGLVVKSESYRLDETIASVMRFDRLTLGKSEAAVDLRIPAPAGVRMVKRLEPDYLALEEARSVSGMEARVPSWLPSGYAFESLDVIRRGRKAVLHSRFSDGVEVLSLFQCPPRLRLGFGGRARRRVKVGSARGTATWTEEGSVLSWSSGGERFVLVGPLPEETLQRVAASIR